MNCPGSVNLSANLPSRSSAAAEEGTAAHELAAKCLIEGSDPSGPMAEAIFVYLDHLDTTHKEGDLDMVEVDLTESLRSFDPDLGGTADHVRYRPSTQELFVTDFKYGAGHFVPAENNYQLQLYALGGLLEVTKHMIGGVKKVTMTIAQPRIEHEDGKIRSWTVPVSELLKFADRAAKAASRTRDANAPLVPGEPQCTFCPARHCCPELEKVQHSLVAAEFSETLPYDPLKLKAALDARELVKARIKALDEFAYAEAERGVEIPGYKLVAKRGVRKWTDEEAVRTWAEAKAIDAFEEPKLKSPAQLEKGLSKKEKEELAEMTVTVSSGHTLVPDSDKRQAVHKALATEFAVLPDSGKTTK